MADVNSKGEGYENLPNYDLAQVLLTCDGRGTIAKKKALDILLERERNKGYDHGYESGVDNERSREI